MLEVVGTTGQIRKTASIHQIHVDEFDGASGNDKLHAAMARRPNFVDKGCMYECCRCSNHIVSLCLTSFGAYCIGWVCVHERRWQSNA